MCQYATLYWDLWIIHFYFLKVGVLLTSDIFFTNVLSSIILQSAALVSVGILFEGSAHLQTMQLLLVMSPACFFPHLWFKFDIAFFLSSNVTFIDTSLLHVRLVF